MLYINFSKFFQLLFHEHIHISILSIALILFLLIIVVGYMVRLIHKNKKKFDALLEENNNLAAKSKKLRQENDTLKKKNKSFSLENDSLKSINVRYKNLNDEKKEASRLVEVYLTKSNQLKQEYILLQKEKIRIECTLKQNIQSLAEKELLANHLSVQLDNANSKCCLLNNKNIELQKALQEKEDTNRKLFLDLRALKEENEKIERFNKELNKEIEKIKKEYSDLERNQIKECSKQKDEATQNLFERLAIW